jgi:hypothetical protein
VGRENPSELKAAKLARSMARGVEDRDLKPNTHERAQIAAVIAAPPNRCARWPPSAAWKSEKRWCSCLLSALQPLRLLP